MKTTRKLTKKEQKRVEILKDVLKHIKAERIVGNTGAVLRYKDNIIMTPDESNVQKILKYMNRKKVKCKTCMRGSLLFSSIWKNNKFHKTFQKYSWSGVCDLGGGIAEEETRENKYLEKIFEKSQLAMMETAFEGKFNNILLGDEIWEKCCDFYDKSSQNDTERIESIIKNAISNKGVFIP